LFLAPYLWPLPIRELDPLQVFDVPPNLFEKTLRNEFQADLIVMVEEFFFDE